MKLYIANKKSSSWSLRPWLLMQQLHMHFAEVSVDLSTPRDERLLVSPTAKVPVLAVNEVLFIHDSLAIIEYLYELDARVYPEDVVARVWSRMVMAEMHVGFSALRQQCAMECTIHVALHAIPPELQCDIQRIEQIWSEGIGRFGGPFLAGKSFTAVDAYFAPVVLRFITYQLPCSVVSQHYMCTIMALPALQMWMTQAQQEPYAMQAYHLHIQEYGVIRR